MTASLFSKAATFLLGVTLLAPSLSAQLIVANNAGFYTAAGDHDSSNTLYFTGAFEGEARSYFTFNLPIFSQPISAATLQVYNFAGSEDTPPGFYSADPSETVTLFSVTTPIPTLVASHTGLASIFNDLGTGPVYGTAVVSDASDGQYVSFGLNSTFLSSLNAVSGGSIAIGAAITTLSDPNGFEFVFGNTDLNSANPAVRLILTPSSTTPVPESAAYGFIGVPLLLFLAIRRRRSVRLRK